MVICAVKLYLGSDVALRQKAALNSMQATTLTLDAGTLVSSSCHCEEQTVVVYTDQMDSRGRRRDEEDKLTDRKRAEEMILRRRSWRNDPLLNQKNDFCLFVCFVVNV